MIRALAQAVVSIKGIILLLAFRPDAERHFDISARGVAHSFLPALISLPLIYFLFAGYDHLAIGLGANIEPGVAFGDVLSSLLRIWLVFPVLTAILVSVTGLKHRYVHWLVMHNWAVGFLLLMQTLIIALYLAGLTGVVATVSLIQIGYLFIRVFTHLRVAMAALNTSLPLAALLGAIPMLVDWVITRLL